MPFIYKDRTTSRITMKLGCEVSLPSVIFDDAPPTVYAETFDTKKTQL